MPIDEGTSTTLTIGSSGTGAFDFEIDWDDDGIGISDLDEFVSGTEPTSTNSSNQPVNLHCV